MVSSLSFNLTNSYPTLPKEFFAARLLLSVHRVWCAAEEVSQTNGNSTQAHYAAV
jgi:hypothetical protein